jgi:DNA-directed RNA polymerase subunit RPC12/RpoP
MNIRIADGFVNNVVILRRLEMKDKSDEIKPFIRLYKCPKCSNIFSLDERFIKSTIIRGYPDKDKDVAKCSDCGYMGLI